MIHLENIWPEWKIIKEIGEGSFGKVYEIRRDDIGGTYKAALKVISIPQDEREITEIISEGMSQEHATRYFQGIVEEIVKEFAMMEKLKGNTNIVSYEDHKVISHTDGVGWDILIRMELLTPLTECIKTKVCSENEVIKLGIDICKALELCRRYHIIHRDIKPENIFVSEFGDYKLGDFGIARTVEKTMTGMSKKGTFTYMAPEVYKGEAYNATVDIYSLGIVLYRLLNNNRAPFLPPAPEMITFNDRENAQNRRLMGEAFPRPARGSNALVEVVTRACAYTSEARFSDAYEMRQALESISKGKDAEEDVWESTEIIKEYIEYVNDSEYEEDEEYDENKKYTENIEDIDDIEYIEYIEGVGNKSSLNTVVTTEFDEMSPMATPNAVKTVFLIAIIVLFISFLGIVRVLYNERYTGETHQAQFQTELETEDVHDVVIENTSVMENEGEVEEEVVDEEFEEFINSCILAMSLEDKVAGLFVVTPEALTGVRTVVRAGEGTQDALNRYAVGGLIYFSQNILNEEQLKEMLSNTVTMSKYPIFLAVDEEGGSVSRLTESGITVANVEDMAAIGAGGDAGKAYEAGVAIGTYMNRIGFNLDFAPVADITKSGNAALGSRSFGEDPELTADMVSNVVKGLEGNGISACLKHFPGIGSANEDTHDGRVEITKTLEEMRDSDFIPFKAGIDAGVNLVMVSHVTASDLDIDGLPSSLSRTVVTDVLREELGYDGIVITDALNMSAISEYYTSQEAAVRAIRAGADMLLMPEDFEAAYKGVLTAVQDGTILEERIDESLRRIYRIKYADKLQ